MWDHNGYDLWAKCPLAIPVAIPAGDTYTIEVVAYQYRVKDLGTSIMEITVESDIETSQGAKSIRNKLVELHEKLLGVTVTADSPEVDAAFRLFVEVWDRERNATNSDRPDSWRAGCWIQDLRYFEEIADDTIIVNEDGYYDIDWDRVGKIMEEDNFHEPPPAVRGWVAILAYFLMDYRYLFL